MDDEPVFKLSEDQNAVAIGETVLKALDSYRRNVPPTGPAGRNPDPVLQFIGVKAATQQVERPGHHLSFHDYGRRGHSSHGGHTRSISTS